MSHRNNDYLIVLDRVENSMWKSPQNTPANIWSNFNTGQRRFCDAPAQRPDLESKVSPEPEVCGIVECNSGFKFAPRLRKQAVTRH